MEQLLPGDPKRIGEYRLLGRLGEGGMGQVFLARSPSGRKVAVKLLKPRLAADPQFRERFVREVDAARQVGGLHTAAVVDADADVNPPWLATTYIDGASLHELVRERGPLSAADLRDLGAGIAEGLAAIHAVGLVHRDLQPGNVIMAADGPRIIDFGIARAVDSSTLTDTGTVLGTYAFMAPEQIRADRAGPAADVFAVGALIVFAATGTSPFDASTIPAIVHRVLNEQPVLDDVPEELRELVEACLAKEPADRPTAAELLARLVVDAEATTPADAEPATPVDAEATAPVGAGTAEEDGAGATRVAASPVDQTRHWPGGETVAEVVPAETVTGKRISRRTMLVGGLAAAGLAAVPVVALWPEAEGEFGDGLKVGELRADDDIDTDKELHAATFSPDGKTVAAVVSGSYVQLWDVDSRKRSTELETGGTDSALEALTFSPDGKMLATGGDTVRLWNIDSGAETMSSAFGGQVTSLAFSPDGTELAVGTGKGLSIWNVVLGSKRTLHYDGMVSVAFSPDGALLAGLCGAETGSGVWRMDDGEPEPGLLDVGGVGSVAFSSDGKRLVAALGSDAEGVDDETGSSGLYAWDVGEGSKEEFSAEPQRQVAFHPDGKRFVTSGGWKIRLRDAETGETVLSFDNDESRSLSFSPDGKLLAAVNDHSRSLVTLYRVE